MSRECGCVTRQFFHDYRGTATWAEFCKSELLGIIDFLQPFLQAGHTTNSVKALKADNIDREINVILCMMLYRYAYLVVLIVVARGVAFSLSVMLCFQLEALVDGQWVMGNKKSEETGMIYSCEVCISYLILI